MSKESQLHVYLGYLWLILAFYGGPGLVVDCQTPDDVNTLLNDLFTNYNPRVRPVQNQMYPVVMDVSLYLFSVNEVDEVNEKLVTTGFLELTWNDTLLQWDPNSYNGVDLLNIPQVHVYSLLTLSDVIRCVCTNGRTKTVVCTSKKKSLTLLSIVIFFLFSKIA